jgi:hypothetical protein
MGMKIRINKKMLFDGVKFDFIMANKPLIDKKIKFYYFENTFIIINHYDDNKLFTFYSYDSFRKKINDIIKDW